MPKKLLRSVYLALGESLIRYGILTWGNIAQCHLDGILKLQKGMIRIFDRGKSNQNCKKNIFERNDVLSVQQLYNFVLIKNNLHASKFRVKESREISKDTRSAKQTKFVFPKSKNSLTLGHDIGTGAMGRGEGVFKSQNYSTDYQKVF